MNVNGSRFHLLLGVTDWGRCRAQPDGAPDEVPLNEAWARLDADAAAPEVALAWDALRQEIRLTPVPIKLPATPGEASPVLSGRRSAAADRSRNIYRIGDDRAELRVWSNGSQADTVFWPDPRAAGQATHGAFAPADAASPPAARFDALATTEDDYLVAAFTDPNGAGLLAFDLAAGGPPARYRWQNGALAAFDMATRAGGGVWILERDAARLWELDRRLTVVGQDTTGPAPAAALFQPADGGPRHLVPSTPLAQGIDLRAALASDLDPIAIDVLPGGAVAILDRGDTAGRSRVFTLAVPASRAPSPAPLVLDRVAHDLTVARTLTRAASAAPLLVIAGANGNEADGYPLDAATGAIIPRQAPELYPLRRFGGRSLVAVRGTANYDSGVTGLRWVPVVQQPRSRFRVQGSLSTPVLDGGEPGCVWDRVILDAAIPAGAAVAVAARSGDARFAAGPDGLDGVAGGWVAQPSPYQRGDGSELPWLRQEAAGTTCPSDGRGSWELLLQDMRGRYLQFRLTLSGPGPVTPSIRALRAWYPRFSYSARLLPGAFREEPVAASFIERFLANFEGFNTALEDRIAQIQVLFDPRTAPADTLDWLAGWFAVALDPSWDEWRRRLLIRHLSAFLRWRGTAHGLHLALAFAFDQDLPRPPFRNGGEAALFDDPTATDRSLLSIRIVEAYQTRLMGAAVAGDPSAAGQSIGQVPTGALWRPAEGNGGLVLRFDPAASLAAQVQPFSLIGPADPTARNAWNAAATANLGFVPTAGADDRQRWQAFLQASVGNNIAALSARHGTTSASFAAIDLPADFPANANAARDWQDFCAASADIQPLGRWQGYLARRWRRITRLNTAWQTHWPSFDVVATPDRLPATAAAQADWLRFEGQMLPIARTAHRFSVLLPVVSAAADPDEMQRRLQLAQRIVEREKPAHTVFDVRFYWALNRVGEARLGLDTLLDVGSRAPQLIPAAVLGRSYIGASFVGDDRPPPNPDRMVLRC